MRGNQKVSKGSPNTGTERGHDREAADEVGGRQTFPLPRNWIEPYDYPDSSDDETHSEVRRGRYAERWDVRPGAAMESTARDALPIRLAEDAETIGREAGSGKRRAAEQVS